MKLSQMTRLGLATLLSVGSLLVVDAPAALAATVTWSGADCTATTPNCNWSDTNNWVGGVVPAAGDDVVIDQSVNQGSGINTDDISGLSLNSLTFINNTSGSDPNYVLDLSTPLNVVNAINQDTSVTTAITEFEGSVVLGGDTTATVNHELSFGETTPSSSSTFNLNGHSLTFTEQTGSASNNPIVAVTIPITGNGSVVYNAPSTDFQMNGASTYTGTTHIIATALPVALGVAQTGVSLFGTSAVTIETGGSATFESDSNVSVSNAFTINGTSNGTQAKALTFGCATTCSSTTISLPSVTLTGNTRFINNDAGMSVDLTGITANGHCVEYTEPAGATSSTFIGGPAGCGVSASSSAPTAAAAATTPPKTPNTGLAAIVAHPAAVLVTTAVAAICLAGIALRFKPELLAKIQK